MLDASGKYTMIGRTETAEVTWMLDEMLAFGIQLGGDTRR